MKTIVAIISVFFILSACEPNNSSRVDPDPTDNGVDTIQNYFDSICNDTSSFYICTDTSNIPFAINNLINYLDAKGDTASTLFIDQYCYHDTIFYLSFTECCDRYNYLLNANGDTLCSPSGGFTGGGDGSCPCFLYKAKKIRTVWEKR
ncbi:MAG TPA: hypothetical protein PKI86_04775 [Chitinophagales bacterium]|nr:hypothetical protein [Chitinophagales bacterium]